MTLSEYVDSVMDGEWFPRGWIVSKTGKVHVEDHEKQGKSLCGEKIPDDPFAIGPARGMLRRLDGCNRCEKKVPDVAEE